MKMWISSSLNWELRKFPSYDLESRRDEGKISRGGRTRKQTTFSWVSQGRFCRPTMLGWRPHVQEFVQGIYAAQRRPHVQDLCGTNWTAYGSWIGKEWERMWEGLREGESDQNTLYKLLKKLIKNKGNLVYLIICKTSVFPYLLLKTSHIFYSYIMIIFPSHCSFFIGKKKPQERK